MADKVKELLKDFADMTTCHGLSRVSGSSWMSLRIIWGLIVLIMTGVLFWNLQRLIVHYNEYPVTIERTRSGGAAMNFPAVTICNLNRFRLSKKHLAGESFQAALDRFEETKRVEAEGKTSKSQKSSRKKRRLNSRSKREAENTTDLWSGTKLPSSSTVPVATVNLTYDDFTNSLSVNQGIASLGSTDRTDSPTVEVTHNNKTIVSEVYLSSSHNFSSTMNVNDNGTEHPTTMHNNFLPKMSSPEKPDFTRDPDQDVVVTAKDNYLPVINEQELLDSNTILNSTDYTLQVWQPNINLTDKAWFADSEDGNTNAQSTNPAEYQQINKTTASSMIVNEMTRLLREIPLNTQRAMGHQIDEMVMDCAWNGLKCSPLDFAGVSTMGYGNCYTFNTGLINPLAVVEKEGSLYGLTLALYVEQNEYISVLSPAAGFRIVLHGHDEQPFPEDDGFDVSPGLLASVSISARLQERKNKPNRPCIGSDYKSDGFLYSKNYSVKACRNSCIQRLTIEQCGCGSPALPLVPTDTKPCSSKDENCMHEVHSGVVQGTLGEDDCSCPVKCNDYIFKPTVSSISWPGNSFLRTLIDQYSGRNDHLAGMRHDTSLFRKNFLKVEIFFEKLNYDKEEEVLSYRVVSLLGDIGGQLGLWLGVSVITQVEFIQLAFELLILLLRKILSSNSKNNRNKKSNVK